MHSTDLVPDVNATPSNQPWWRELNGYHWFVFTVAALGWLADCMDQQLFNLARKQAVTDLLGPLPDSEQYRIDNWATGATSIFLIGWAIGGIAFGITGDRWGRVKTMLLTILIYSVFTGLSAVSPDIWWFCIFRFLTGLGVGGEFAVGVALLAEIMPDRARPHALGLLQALSAVGNCTAAGLFMLLGYLVQENMLNMELFGKAIAPWRVMFLFGLTPAVLALAVRGRLKEPERWKAVAGAASKKLGSFAELFGDPRWRKNALVGLALAFAGVVGLWGIGFFSIDLQQSIFKETFKQEGLEGATLRGQSMIWAGITSLMLNMGAFFGIYGFSYVTQFTGRKPAFAVSFVLAMGSTAMVFWLLKTRADLFWMLPLMGFCQLSLFGGYAIYFPELFPTRLRSTGTSFCYNVGRLVAATGPLGLGILTSEVFVSTAASSGDPNMPRRLAGVTMCAVFLIGLIALPFAPETKGKPLPE